MAQVCDVCGKGPQFGNNISHAHNVTKRRWNVNLQAVKALSERQSQRIPVWPNCIKTGKIAKRDVRRARCRLSRQEYVDSRQTSLTEAGFLLLGVPELTELPGAPGLDFQTGESDRPITSFLRLFESARHRTHMSNLRIAVERPHPRLFPQI